MLLTCNSYTVPSPWKQIHPFVLYLCPPLSRNNKVSNRTTTLSPWRNWIQRVAAQSHTVWTDIGCNPTWIDTHPSHFLLPFLSPSLSLALSLYLMFFLSLSFFLSPCPLSLLLYQSLPPIPLYWVISPLSLYLQPESACGISVVLLRFSKTQWVYGSLGSRPLLRYASPVPPPPLCSVWSPEGPLFLSLRQWLGIRCAGGCYLCGISSLTYSLSSAPSLSSAWVLQHWVFRIFKKWIAFEQCLFVWVPRRYNLCYIWYKHSSFQYFWHKLSVFIVAQ